MQRHLADGGRAGEGNHINVGMLGNMLTDNRTAAGDDVKHAVRQARFFKDAGQQQGRAGGDLSGLGHQRTARRQNIGVAFCANKEGEVPRGDDADDANRFAGHQAQHAVAEVIKAVTLDAARQTRGILPNIRSTLNFTAGLGDRFAGLKRFQQRQLGQLFADQLRGFQQYRRPRRAANPRPLPGVKGFPGRFYRVINVFSGAGRVAADDNIVGRAFTHKVFAAVAGGPFAVDEHLKLACFFGQQSVVNVYRAKCIAHNPLPIVHSMSYRTVRAGV